MHFTERLRGPVMRGEVTCSVRIWQSPRVKLGGRYPLGAGAIEITALREIARKDITPALAKRSGFASVADLMKIAKHGAGERIFLVEFVYRGEAGALAPPKLQPPYAVRDGGVRLAVRLTPRAKRAELAGLVEDVDGRAALHIKLDAPPVDGEANDALIAYVAKALKLKQRDVTIVLGAQTRNKVLHLAGDAAEIAQRLEKWIATLSLA